MFLSLALGLMAQDISPGPLVWLSLDDVPDQLPVARGLPDAVLSDAQKEVSEPGYIECRLSVSAKGAVAVWGRAATSPWLDLDFVKPAWNFIPAKREGEPVASDVVLPFIYNPRSADARAPNSTARLLAIRPPVYPDVVRAELERSKVPASEIPSELVRVHAEVDANGGVTEARPIGAENRAFGEAAVEAVRGWKFMPARAEGRPIASALELVVLFQRPYRIRTTDADVMPKTIKSRAPNYPEQMYRSGIPGGEVTVSFTITVEGRVSDVWVNSSTHPGFEEEALAAIGEWRFAPALLDGRPVPCQALQSFHFTRDENRPYGFSVPRPKAFPAELPQQYHYEIAPELTDMELPVYPLEELQAGRKGRVMIACVVAPDGYVHQIKVLPDTTSPAFGAAAVAALEQYKFKPAARDGKPCYAAIRIDFEFSPDGRSGHAQVSQATKRVLKIMAKEPGKLVSGADLDRLPELRSSGGARLARHAGEALIEVVLDENGVPRLPRIISATTPAFGYAAIQTISTWRFMPPKLNGKSVDALVRLPIASKK